MYFFTFRRYCCEYTQDVETMILYISANTKNFVPYDNTYVALLVITASLNYNIQSYKKKHTVNVIQDNPYFIVAKTVQKGIYSWRIYIK